MDALKFFKERMRMCDYYPRCFECPRADEPNCNIEEMSYEELKNFVNTVEQWSKEHPPRTRLQDFMENIRMHRYVKVDCRALAAKVWGIARAMIL